MFFTGPGNPRTDQGKESDCGHLAGPARVPTAAGGIIPGVGAGLAGRAGEEGQHSCIFLFSEAFAQRVSGR